MELLFGEFIKQLIAAILAIFMPLSAGATIAEHAKGQTTITVPPPVVERVEVESTDDQLVEANPEVPAEEEAAVETPAE